VTTIANGWEATR